MVNNLVRHDWTEKEIFEIYNTPLLDLVYKAATIHRKFHEPSEVQVSSLLSIKTGACSEDCAYCPQSARYKIGVGVEPLMEVEQVVEASLEKAEKLRKSILKSAFEGKLVDMEGEIR